MEQQQAVTETIVIHSHLRCVGYFGFGGGWEIGNLGLPPEQAAGRVFYCNGCPLAKECWEQHKLRVRELYPDICEAEDEMIRRGVQGPALIMAMTQRFGTEPLSAVNMGNIEDGIAVGFGGRPKDRGPDTLKFPFASA